MNQRRHDESGQVLILVVGLALVAFAAAGLAVDGTRAFLLRRSLQNSADAAATSAASVLDRSVIYSGAQGIAIDTEEASAVAIEMLDRRQLPPDTDLDLDVTVDRVHVELRSTMPTSFLGLIGVGSVPVAVSAQAAPFASD